MRRCPQLLSSWTGSKHPRSYVSLQWHDRIGKFHAKSHLYFTTLIGMPAQQSRLPACITHHQSSSTRIYAVGFHPSHSCKTCTPHCGRTLPLLCSYWSLHPELSRQTPTPCGEYPPTRARHFHVIFVISTTTHPWSLCCNLCPCSLLGQFYIQDLLSRLHLPWRTPCLGAQSRNHSGKSVGAWVSKMHCSPFETVWVPAWRDHHLSGTRGTYCGYHPGTRWLNPPFSRGQMGTMCDHSLEWVLATELSHHGTQAALLPIPAQLSSTPRWEPRAGTSSPPSHLTMRLSKMSSVSRQPLVYHLTGHGTVLSTCCLGPSYPRVEYNLCPSWSARLWMITSRRLDVKYSSNHPPHLRPPAAASWARRMGAWGLALTTLL